MHKVISPQCVGGGWIIWCVYAKTLEENYHF